MRKNKKYTVQIVIVVLCVIFIMLCVLMAIPSNASCGVTTQRQDDLHATADALRAMGVSEDSEEIKMLQRLWWEEQERLDITAKVIDHEATPLYCDWNHSVAVGAVIVNREKSPYFPNTIKDVVAAPGQYLKSYTYGFEKTSELAYLAAKAALDGNHDVPDNAFWQDTNPQGKYVWQEFVCDTGYFKSTTYICCGIPGTDV